MGHNKVGAGMSHQKISATTLRFGVEEHAMRILLLMVLASGLGLAQVGNQTHFRYHGEVIEVGDSKYEIMAKLGQPDGKLHRQRQFTRKVDRSAVETTYLDEEKWLYNFGPRRFFYILTLENQRLVCIEEGDYGYVQSDASNCHWVSKRVKVGDISPVVLMKCGEPSFEEVTYTDRYVRINRHQGEQVTLKREQWTYNFGPSQPLGILHFENGTLVSVERGPRGF